MVKCSDARQFMTASSAVVAASPTLPTAGISAVSAPSSRNFRQASASSVNDESSTRVMILSNSARTRRGFRAEEALFPLSKAASAALHSEYDTLGSHIA